MVLMSLSAGQQKRHRQSRLVDTVGKQRAGRMGRQHIGTTTYAVRYSTYTP